MTYPINQIEIYDNALLDKAKQLTARKGEAQLTLDDMAFLLKWTLNQGPLTATQLNTLKYIRTHLSLSASAASFFDLKLSML